MPDRHSTTAPLSVTFHWYLTSPWCRLGNLEIWT